ncbi:GNAT family N-acetyltransferase [Heyndrickxia oleronia]|uniref:GNAT family N-acetyltransferase n=2 Tax=Heyndrickxia oleronia TaxID=38875 RepID=A0AAW6T1N3_9BACI|nr:GNAT family N-acetyltransferase [Heyndrickxia oleronia]
MRKVVMHYGFVKERFDNNLRNNRIKGFICFACVELEVVEAIIITIKIMPINHLLNHDLSDLILESKQDGFRFLNRLLEEYRSGANTFNQPGEGIFGAFHKNEELIGIGGLTIDPYSNDKNIGRIRRFYVSKSFRRQGVGNLLLHEILSYARGFFKVIVLRTDTYPADQFYVSFGFKKTNIYPQSTHYFLLDSKTKDWMKYRKHLNS